jgi:Tol biopolymer transport system component
VDTFSKASPNWSNDGKKIVYNRESNGRGRDATLELCVVDIQTKEIKQITESGKYKSYSPVWAPEGDKIVYYFEKGDNHDQVWLTDSKGSFHANLTNDTSTHNFYPSWIDKNTIVYTLSPNNIMTMRINGSNKQKVEGINSFLVRYNPATKQAAYITQQPDSKLMLFDWEKKTAIILLDQPALKGLL